MNLSRRRLLTITGASCVTALAGCSDSEDDIPEIDDSVLLPEEHPELFESDLNRDNDFVLYWFWVPNRDMVESQIEFIVGLQNEYPDLTVVSLNTRDDEKNNLYIKMLQTHFEFDLENADEDDIEYPATAIGTEFFQGDSPETRTNIETAVEQCANEGCPNALEWMDEQIEAYEAEMQEEGRREREEEEDDREVNEELEQRLEEIEGEDSDEDTSQDDENDDETDEAEEDDSSTSE